MARLNLVDPESASGAAKEWVDAVHSALGVTPNMAKGMGDRLPDRLGGRRRRRLGGAQGTHARGLGHGHPLTMYVKEIWRYPVKSLKGEQLASAYVDEAGIEGDRLVYLAAGERVITSRTHPALLALRATLGGDGEPRIEGDPWSDPTSLEKVRAVADRPNAELLRAPNGAFDVLPLTVATDGTVEFLGIDRRRLRPNIVIGGVEGLDERQWPGRRLLIGEVSISIARLRPRCVMTTWDPDTQERDSSVLRRIVRELDGSAALDCAVEQAGVIEVGATVRLA